MFSCKVARYKSQIFSRIDPNLEMEKYAQSSAASAGLPLSNFEFIHAVREVIPLSDNSLVLCSVKDVDMTLKVDFCDVFLYGCSVTSLKSLVTQRRRRLTKSWRLAYAYLSYYGSNPDVQVVGIDPNLEMEKYARSSAASAGLPLSNFEFIHAVGEVIPLSDNSVDAVVGTLVFCSVKDVDMTLKEVRRVLRLRGTLADGCHLSRETGDGITRAGFSSVELEMAFLSNASFVNPHAYGIAYQ
ncbi:S-adenosyl-L-methionine-dependent methyltransferase superfamily protein [Trifolium repens]|nr:S-adenosyl-L-methionine-dependent methyltransferase superfamily protein [Trifolium repens]